jgi:hypothetical protein
MIATSLFCYQIRTVYVRSRNEFGGQIVPVTWTRHADSSLAGVISAEDGRLYRLLAERLPENGWDWAVWMHGAPGETRSGYAPTSQLARDWAEVALNDMMASVCERT